MTREHVRHLHHAIDDRSLPIRGAITVAALLSLPLLALAHVPFVVALIAVWSIGCDVCRSEDSE